VPPIRLRYVLLASLVVGTVGWVVPRAKAAWRAHELGPAFGDYAVCMAGPSGAQLLRDDPSSFRRLVRRRLIAAAPNEAPFARCAASAEKISGSDAVKRTHETVAERFAEYGTDPAARVLLDTLVLGLDPLRECVSEAWPFVRARSGTLVRPSLTAREAVHPVAPPEPGLGRGLPATIGLVKSAWRYRDQQLVAFGLGATRSLVASGDGGVSFRPAADMHAAELESERCSGRDPSRGFALSTAEDGSLIVTAAVPDAEPRPAVAVPGEHRVMAIACDDQALVVAARREGQSRTELSLCRPEQRCEALQLPARVPFSPLTLDSFDVTRTAGATIVSVASNGVVRVISTRDDGKSWTPPSVAFDAGELAGANRAQDAPWHLVSLGSRVLIYGNQSKATGGYPLLASDDQGASFHALSDVQPVPRERLASTRPSR
jgi:hypothetical protein